MQSIVSVLTCVDRSVRSDVVQLLLIVSRLHCESNKLLFAANAKLWPQGSFGLKAKDWIILSDMGGRKWS